MAFRWRSLRYWAWLLIGIIPVVAALPAQQRGVFVASEAWSAAWPGLFLSVLAVGAVLLVLDQLIAYAARRSRKEAPTKFGTTANRIFVTVVALMLPIWAWGITDLGFKRLNHDRDDLGEVAAPATMVSYNASGKQRTHYVIVMSEEFGRVRLRSPELSPEDIPQKGAAVTMVGHRSWVGVSYDELMLPE
jgi:uncharacterized membrane protein